MNPRRGQKGRIGVSSDKREGQGKNGHACRIAKQGGQVPRPRFPVCVLRVPQPCWFRRLGSVRHAHARPWASTTPDTAGRALVPCCRTFLAGAAGDPSSRPAGAGGGGCSPVVRCPSPAGRAYGRRSPFGWSVLPACSSRSSCRKSSRPRSGSRSVSFRMWATFFQPPCTARRSSATARAAYCSASVDRSAGGRSASRSAAGTQRAKTQAASQRTPAGTPWAAVISVQERAGSHGPGSKRSRGDFGFSSEIPSASPRRLAAHVGHLHAPQASTRLR